MKTIGIVTTARSDYSLYLPILKKIKADDDLRLYLIISGMHLSPEFGLSVKAIEADGFKIDERIEMLLSSDTPEGISKSMGLGIIGFAQAFSRFRPDILMILGDRFEMYTAAVAALPYKIPIAHIHGGEITQGAIDDAIRHSITKLSHLHFVSNKIYAKRVIQLGEEPWRVTTSGAPGLDNLNSVKILSIDEIEKKYHLKIDTPPLLVTFHPVTLEYEKTEWHINELLLALEMIKLPIIFTLPNADTGGKIIIEKIDQFTRNHKNACIIKNFGTTGYFSMMTKAAAMVGNSSSGIIEAASFKLPVVNLGDRQKGRIRGKNVIDVRHDKESILKGIHQALSNEFKTNIQTLKNPYGSGNASEIIVDVLKKLNINEKLIVKKFVDLENTIPLEAE